MNKKSMAKIKTTLEIEPEKLLQATHGDPDHPLRIANLEIPCYVLEDGRRVIVRNGLLSAMGMSEGTAAAKATGDRLARFIATKGIQESVSPELAKVINQPIRFGRAGGASQFYGYEATVLADLCSAVLDARDHSRLNYQQQHIADRCDLLVRALSKVGIIALVDEATGYQYSRARDALAEILEKFIGEELRRWVKTFPDEFYRLLFKLRGLTYSQFTTKRPIIIGKLTNDIVYERLAPEVLIELQKRNPKLPSGRRRHKHFQWLTEDIGHPRLQEHLYAVIALMRAAPTWDAFYRSLQRALPKHTEQLTLIDIPIEDE